MKPIALIILVLVVHCESLCKRTAFVEKRLKDLKDEELKNLLKRQVKGSVDNDCIITYQVTFDDQKIPFYPFLIGRKGKNAFGMVWSNNYKYNWTKWDSEKFTRYYKWCHEDKKSDSFLLPLIHEPLPHGLKCGFKM